MFICPSVALGEPVAERQLYPWSEELDTDEDWAKYNRYCCGRPDLLGSS